MGGGAAGQCKAWEGSTHGTPSPKQTPQRCPSALGCVASVHPAWPSLCGQALREYCPHPRRYPTACTPELMGALLHLGPHPPAQEGSVRSANSPPQMWGGWKGGSGMLPSSLQGCGPALSQPSVEDGDSLARSLWSAPEAEPRAASPCRKALWGLPQESCWLWELQAPYKKKFHVSEKTL